MQQLKERRTSNTPANIPHVRSNCGTVLNSLYGVSGSVLCSKTSFNNSDAALTLKEHRGQDLRVPVVYVLNRRGKPLMPCSPRKARILLKKGHAYVTKRTPFTIKLKKSTGESIQSIKLGVDSGYNHIGLSASSDKKELFAAEVQLRTDIVDLNSERRSYRRTRRSRKTWYRKPRFSNRKKSEGWLPPSIQHKMDTHIKIIKKVKSLLPIEDIKVEVAAFDIQNIKNPKIESEEYQNGEQSGFWNVREYILFRDGHKCRHCKGKSKDPVLNVHHIKSRKTGGDRPDNLITLCETCHKKYHQGEISLRIKSSKGFKAETFMSMVRRTQQYLIKPVRKSNRKLYKGVRSHIRNTAPRLIKGFQRYDKVLWKKQDCFIFGRRRTGYFDIRTLSGIKLHASVKCSELKLTESFNTFLWERKSDSSST